MDLRRPLPFRGLNPVYLLLLTSEGRFDNPLPFDGLVAHEGPQLDLQGHLGRLDMKEKAGQRSKEKAAKIKGSEILALAHVAR